MAPKYKLTYFQCKALGEPIRFLLSYGNLEFEDYMFPNEEWPQIKPTTPFGRIPVLEIEGKKVSQSTAICRFLAKQLNLVGKNDWDAFQADSIVDTIKDFWIYMLKNIYYEPNEELKEKNLQLAQKETVPFYLIRFDKHVEENEGYFVNGQLTWADLFFIAISESLEKITVSDFFKDYPNLKQLKEKVHAIPQIQAWIAKRPETEL